MKKSNKNQTVERNKAFEKMTPAQKRVAIAEDVLEQIKLNKLMATEGVWLSNAGNKNRSMLYTDKDVKQNRELRDVLNKTPVCHGCAIGGIFMCAVKKLDELKVNSLAEDSREDLGIQLNDIFSYLLKQKLFTKSQLQLIELAFEEGSGGIDTDSFVGDEDLAQDATDYFYDDVFSAEEKMRIIMENIIVNKGTFKVSDKPRRFYTCLRTA